ncbi:MAG TPA: hypothetical protein PL009_07845 [Flavipsychrobacter sp.]|nr:hypothetical protein [Flavipsychrobacter sp.]
MYTATLPVSSSVLRHIMLPSDAYTVVNSLRTTKDALAIANRLLFINHPLLCIHIDALAASSNPGDTNKAPLSVHMKAMDVASYCRAGASGLLAVSKRLLFTASHIMGVPISAMSVAARSFTIHKAHLFINKELSTKKLAPFPASIIQLRE